MKRRNFMKTTAAAVAAPMIVPSSVFGKSAPSNKIVVGQIGRDDLKRMRTEAQVGVRYR